MSSVVTHLKIFLKSRIPTLPNPENDDPLVPISYQEATSTDGIMRIQCLTFFTKAEVFSNKLKKDFNVFLDDISYPGWVVGVDIMGERVDVYVKD